MLAEIGCSAGVGDGCLSIGKLLQHFPGLVITIAGFLDQESKKRFRICSKACKAAVDPLLMHVTVSGRVRGSIPLLQNANWRHLQQLRLM